MSVAREPGWLTFRWPERRRFSFLLPGFIALSAFGHALMLYVFQVTYPLTVSVTPPPVQVSLLTPENPQSAALQRWLEAEDPAIVAATPEVLPPGVLDLPYQPSFATAQTQPKSPPPPPATWEFPAARTALDIVQSALTPPRRAGEPLPAPQTAVRLSAALDARRPEEAPLFSPEPVGTPALLPVRIFAGVDDAGKVRYTFFENSSGDPALDRQAEAHLTQMQFAAAPNAEVTWGFATYVWGAEAFRETSPSADPKLEPRRP